MERELLARLYEKYARAALLYTCSLCRDFHLAEDVVQEAFVRAYLSAPKEENSFLCWLMTVCRHLAIDHLRRRRRLSDGEVPEGGGGGEPERLLLHQEDTRLLYQAMQQLSASDREMLTLHYFVQLPISRIAALLHLTPSATKVRLHRARGRLRNKMEENGYEI